MPNTIRLRIRAAVVAVLAALVVPALVPSHASAGVSRFEWRVIAQINAVRAQHGLPAVGQRGMLSSAAGRHATRLRRRGQLMHSSTKRLSRRAGSPIGEVVAWNSKRRAGARSVVRSWLKSPPHRAVLLDGAYRTVGVGASRGRRGLFVTADFAKR